MSGHTFGARLYFLRWPVKRLPRQQLAKELRKRANKLPPETGAKLMGVTAEDIRVWEKGWAEPPSIAGQVICESLGFARELLDAATPEEAIPAGGFLQIARSKGWGQLEIGHFWKLMQDRAMFSGVPTAADWDQVLAAASSFIPAASQGTFLDEFLCTHCGHWEGTPQLACPRCGMAD